jgi:hypothetical protein
MVDCIDSDNKNNQVWCSNISFDYGGWMVLVIAIQIGQNSKSGLEKI